MSDPDATIGQILELDEVFAALGHSRRRYLLYALATDGMEVSLSDLATRIAAWERDKRPADVTADERRAVHVSLYHSHVPKLEELGVLEYDEADDSVVRALNTAQVEAVLDVAGAELDSRLETHAKQ